MDCKPFITDPFAFPRRVHNRPALPRLARRIGRYEDFLEAMLREVDAAGALAAWTHREPDDPAIALLQGAAIVGDILSFYQEHYANEAYLRTAAWRESVADLVRLTGYRLAPGLGGRATFAFEVRGPAPVTIPAGLPIRADLQDVTGTAEFETTAELIAHPQLGRFSLYRRRVAQPTIAAGQTVLEITAVGTATDAHSLAALALKAGDLLMLTPGEGMFSRNGAPVVAQQAPQLLKVRSVETRVGRLLVTFENGPAQDWSAPVRAYKVGRSFRHFGHQAPPQVLQPQLSGTTVIGTTAASTRYVRAMNRTASTSGFGSAYTALSRDEMPLDVEAPDMAAGRQVIVQGQVDLDGRRGALPFTVVRTVSASQARSLQWGNVIGPSTVLTLDRRLFDNRLITGESVDIRELRLHEITSPRLTVRPPSGFASGEFGDGTRALNFFGTAQQAAPLAGRSLFFAHADGRTAVRRCTNVPDDFRSTSASPRLWALSFDAAPEPFVNEDFDETAPSVTVFGNLAEATQGKREREAVLGHGDQGQVFQTFPLPKAPLTYLLDAAATPPQQPELEIWVAGRLWTRVDALFGHGPTETVYIVREDAEGRSYVQFGDGETGARLPSGVDNVVARMRSGSGARGPVKPGVPPTAPQRPVGLDKLSLAGIVSGGAEPETLDKAREAAPGKVQSLGRLVSLRDHETETLALPGVVAARADWDLAQGVPAILLRVLLASGREGEFAAVRDAIALAQRSRGPDRHPIVVQQALLRHVFLDLRYARDPVVDPGQVAGAVRAALGLAGSSADERSGIFGLHARGLGEREYASRIQGRVQQVPGVRWCEVTALGRLPGSGAEDPASLALPASPRAYHRTLSCGPQELLQLHPAHLTLTEVSDTAAGGTS